MAGCWVGGADIVSFLGEGAMATNARGARNASRCGTMTGELEGQQQLWHWKRYCLVPVVVCGGCKYLLLHCCRND